MNVGVEDKRMVKANTQGEYVCEQCGFRYETESRARQCENWCREHKSCNLEIIAHGKPPEE